MKQHNLFSNWSPEAPKTLQNTLFYKHSGHKKHNFWTVHTQSLQFDCSIIDWSNTIYSQNEALKTSKRPEAFLFTSPMDTRNTTFERSTLNLPNLIVPLLNEATQFILKLKPWRLQNVSKHSFLQAQWTQETQLLNGRLINLRILIVPSWIDATQIIL